VAVRRPLAHRQDSGIVTIRPGLTVPVTRIAQQPPDGVELGVLSLHAADPAAPEPRPRLAIGISAAGDTLLVHVVGELDLATAPRLASCLRDLRGRAARVAVDLAGVKFIDLSGFRVLLDAQRDAESDGGQVRVAAPGRAYSRLLALIHSVDRM
jgi:anti-anti-sigma factor